MTVTARISAGLSLFILIFLWPVAAVISHPDAAAGAEGIHPRVGDGTDFCLPCAHPVFGDIWNDLFSLCPTVGFDQ